jgi:hypothetical protein
VVKDGCVGVKTIQGGLTCVGEEFGGIHGLVSLVGISEQLIRVGGVVIRFVVGE